MRVHPVTTTEINGKTRIKNKEIHMHTNVLYSGISFFNGDQQYFMQVASYKRVSIRNQRQVIAALV